MSNKSTRVISIVGAVVALTLITAVYYSGIGESQQPSTEPNLIVSNLPSIGLTDVLNSTRALGYGIEGLVKISGVPGSPSSYSVNPGESLKIPILITFVSYNKSVNDAVLDFTVEQGLHQVGVVDVSSMETYSSSKVILSSPQETTIYLSITVPLQTPPISFGLSADGANVSSPEIKVSQTLFHGYPVTISSGQIVIWDDLTATVSIT